MGCWGNERTTEDGEEDEDERDRETDEYEYENEYGSESCMQNESEQVMWRGEWIMAVKRGRWEYAKRARSITGIVGMVPVTDEGRLVLVEQYRPAVNANVIELPAGLVGDEAARAREPLEDAARRELTEETGYEAGRMEMLADVVPSAGISGESMVLYLASGLRKVGPGGGDEHEDITVHEVPLAEVEAFCKARQREGAAIDAKVYAGLYFCTRRGM
jgi:ADP-ribose pyrophosphatase